MSVIGNTVISSNTGILAQQLAKTSTRPAPNKDTSITTSDNSSPVKSDTPNSQLTSFLNKWSEAKQAIEKLGNATQEINQSKKAFAAEVIKRIKEQIRIMMMLTGGDPKARAKQIAALAKELAAAAREYASASGDTSQPSEATAADGANSQTAATASSTGEQSNSTGAASTVEGASGGTADVSPTTQAETAQSPQNPLDSTHQSNELLGNKIAAYTQTSSATSVSKEDQEFAMEVRRLAAQLKALAKQNEARTHKGADQSIERETADTNEALREVEQSVSIIESPNVSYAPSINIVAG
jgi:organic radical activating enzyme